MRLNPDKFSFKVQADKFLGFILAHRGIEANPNKCKAIINMRRPKSVKEVHQLTGRLATLSRFLSYVKDKSRHFFVAIKKLIEFKWTKECERTFTELKQFLSTMSIFVCPRENSPLTLYLAVSEKAIISVLVHDNVGDERPIYFVNKDIKGVEIHYQKIERLALAVVITSRKLR